MQCPCCGQPVSQVPFAALSEVSAGTVTGKILEALCEIYPRSMSYERLAYVVYGESDGPENEYNVLSVLVNKLRPKLKALGWDIPRSPPNTRARLRLAPMASVERIEA